MLPAAVAFAMVGFIGAFGGSTPTAHAIEGDICSVQTDATSAGAAGQFDEPVDYVVSPGVTHGLVFRVEDSYRDNVAIRIDSETGSARITSQAEILDIASGFVDDNDDVQDLGQWRRPEHRPHPGPALHGFDRGRHHGALSTSTTPTATRWTPSATGWSTSATLPSQQRQRRWSPCDSGDFIDGTTRLPTERLRRLDGWGFIDFECIESGYFHIDISSPDDTEEIGATAKFYCTGQAESATIATQYSTLESSPAAGSHDESIITVTVEDQFGDRIDGVEVELTTTDCKLKSDGGDDIPGGSNPIAPAAGGTSVTVYSDTDSDSDYDYLADNPLEHSAGTAEAILDCSPGGPGVVTVRATVHREGSNIDLKTEVTVVGPTSVTGLTLTLTPDDLECGETILATAHAVDSLGANVSNGTVIHFTTDTSSGIVGGSEGAQGGVGTTSGEASVLIATDPSNPGVHTVIAYSTKGNDGDIIAQTSATYTCDAAVAPAAPTVAPPATGTGTGSITPPNTGDAGLAAGSTSNASLFVIVGAAFVVLAGFVGFKFTRE